VSQTTGQDASVSLLQRVVGDSLDPTYAEVARRRSAAGGSSHAPRQRRLAVGSALAALGLLASVAVAQTWRDLPEAERSRAALVDRVKAATAADDRQAEQVQALAASVERLRAAAFGAAGADSDLNARLTSLEAAAGTTAVTGPGVQVVLDDGPPSPDSGVGPDLAKVLDRDLQSAVNGLFASGAEAVDVNGERITTVTAIRSAGDAILVGYRPLTRPYVVTAIGDPLTLEARFADSQGGQSLQTLATTYGMRFETSTHDSLTVAGQPPASLRYATPRER